MAALLPQWKANSEEKQREKSLQWVMGSQSGQPVCDWRANVKDIFCLELYCLLKVKVPKVLCKKLTSWEHSQARAPGEMHVPHICYLPLLPTQGLDPLCPQSALSFSYWNLWLQCNCEWCFSHHFPVCFRDGLCCYHRKWMLDYRNGNANRRRSCRKKKGSRKMLSNPKGLYFRVHYQANKAIPASILPSLKLSFLLSYSQAAESLY